MRQPLVPSIASVLALAAIGLGVLWLGPRPVYELWTVEELEEPAGDFAEAAVPARGDRLNVPACFVADVDGDGDDDLVHYDPRRGVAIGYENRGAAGLKRIALPQTTGGHSLTRFASRPRGRSLTWEEARARSESRNLLRPEWERRGLFFDADRDGDLDVVFPEKHEGSDLVTLRFYMQLESGYREIGARLGPAWTTPREISDIVCGDFDADGLIDIALARPGAPPVILWNRFARP